MDFKTFMRLVDAILLKRVGMTSADIDDWRYHDDWKDGLTATRCAARAIRHAKDM